MSQAPRPVRVAIVGSGPAGWTAAIYAARAMLKPVVICGLQPGGQMTITTDVENYPGFPDVIQGPWLMDQMRDQALACGTEVISDVVVSADLSKRPFRLECDSGDVYEAEVLIIATGAQAKWLGLESEQKYKRLLAMSCLRHLRRLLLPWQGDRGDRRRRLRVGGGHLPHQVRQPRDALIHRRDELHRSEKILQERLFASTRRSR